MTTPEPNGPATPVPEQYGQHRAQLVGHCYRMLGSLADAEDAVQEALLRAWRRHDQFDPTRGSMINWLYGIATHAAIDLSRSRQRRALPTGLGPAAEPGADLGTPLSDAHWVLPAPDHRVLPDSSALSADPADQAVLRESVRLAFIDALQRLPARQRAVLILRDVLAWSAAEVAELLDLSIASVTSLLQRARATIGDQQLGRHRECDHELLDRYVEAFTRHDIAALVEVLHNDATMAMPPFPWWIRGGEQIAIAQATADFCRGSVFVPIRANGVRAYAQYLPDDTGGLRGWAILFLEPAESPPGAEPSSDPASSDLAGRIGSIIGFLEVDPLFEIFGLPVHRPMSPAGLVRTAGEGSDQREDLR